MDADHLATAEAAIPVGGFGTTNEIVAAVAYLCGADSTYVTDATLDINGGSPHAPTVGASGARTEGIP